MRHAYGNANGDTYSNFKPDSYANGNIYAYGNANGDAHIHAYWHA